MKYANSVVDLVGNTPLVKLNTASKNSALVLGKCEFMNPSHSVKDRIGVAMINDAINKGLINDDTTIVEPTSGNTGIGLASVCASKKLKLILTMPSSMSVERQKLLKALGAHIVLTDTVLGMSGAINKAKELSGELSNSIILQQFSNPSNPAIHRTTTAEEIWRDTNGKIDIFVAAVGTGGTVTGVGERLKELNPNIKIIAVEPRDSAVLSGCAPAPHKIQGIGAGFVPEVLNRSIIDEIVTVSNEDAIMTARELASNEGLLVGISAGANIFASSVIASRADNKDKIIVTILCDTGERYLSTTLYED
jgi:cysteine synthase A